MASILDILHTPAGKLLIKRVSDRSGENPERVATALAIILPVTLGALKQNLQDKEFSDELGNWLTKKQKMLHDKLREEKSEELYAEGLKISSTILGKNRDEISGLVGNILEIKTEKIKEMLIMSVPVIINILGNQQRKENIQKEEFEELVASVMGCNSSYEKSLVESLLEGKDQEANIIENVSGIILGGGKRGKKKGSILGGYTGGK